MRIFAESCTAERVQNAQVHQLQKPMLLVSAVCACSRLEYGFWVSSLSKFLQYLLLPVYTTTELGL